MTPGSGLGGLSVGAVVDLGGFALDAAVEVGDGEVVAVVGPNGAGKTTLLRAVAGLVALRAGRVVLGGRVLDDPAAGTWVPPAGRDVGVVFQDQLLFPHLDAVDNVAFGLRARGVPAPDARRRAAAWLGRFGLGERGAARPDRLSGGEAQRVALARALAVEPAALLLDEPLAAVDAAARVALRAELARHLRQGGGPRLLVTHDPVDAFVLADRVVVLEGGRITQDGTPAALARHPRSPYVAAFLGVNLLHGTVAAPGAVRLASGGEIRVADDLPPPGTAVAVAVRPQAVALHRRQPEGSARNRWPLRVTEVEDGGGRARVSLAGAVELVAEVTSGAAADLGLAPGAEVWASVKAVDVSTYGLEP